MDAMFENTGTTKVYLIPPEQLMGQKAKTRKLMAKIPSF